MLGCGIIIGTVVGFGCGRGRSAGTSGGDIVRDTVTRVALDTVFVLEPKPTRESMIRYVQVPMPTTITDTIMVVDTDTIRIEGDSVRLPITQRVYKDSTYIAYVSGWKVSLDSIAVVNRTETRSINSIVYQKSSRWSVGIVAGYGYAIKSRRLEPFVGVGVSYRIW